MAGDEVSTAAGGSASINAPDYWWYRARTELLATVLHPYVVDADSVLDVGSADGPSVSWLRRIRHHVPLDLDPRGLPAGGVCGSVLALPFKDSTFDVVGAFDVLEHCDPEDVALAEMVRILRPGGRLLLSVPAYQWAWTDFDEHNGHHRRYTRRRAISAVESAGLRVLRSTHAFASVFPMFTAERLAGRVRRRLTGAAPATPADIVPLPQVPPLVDSMLRGLCRIDNVVLSRTDLPFGSSVVLAAQKQ